VKPVRARWHHGAWLVVAGATVFVVLSACQLIAGIPDAVRYDCPACTQAQCSVQAAACAASPGCNALEECLSACNGEPACRSQCTIANPVVPLMEEGGVEVDGIDVTMAGALDACLVSQCATQCNLACGALSKIAPPNEAPSCAACLQKSTMPANDCAIAQECASDPRCQEYLLCRQNCVTGDCVGACLNPTSSFFGFITPARDQCAGACQIGSNWGCVGKVQWPRAQSQIRNVTLHYLRDLQGRNEVGVTVFMCEATDFFCENPVSSSQTDDEGGVTLTDSTLLNGQDLGLNGFLALNARAGDASAADSMLHPTFVYWGFPVTIVDGLIAETLPVPTMDNWNVDLGTLTMGLDPTLGVVAAVALDCFGFQAGDVSLALSGPGDAGEPAPFYVAGLSPITMQPGPGPGTIAAIFGNVPPGPLDVIATPTGLGRPSSRVSIYVKAGTLTEVFLQPTPDPVDGGGGP
jgi:hypothetical protein